MRYAWNVNGAASAVTWLELRREIEGGLEENARTLEPRVGSGRLATRCPARCSPIVGHDDALPTGAAGVLARARSPGGSVYPLGSGTLGYAWPAALGAAAALPDTPVLAVVGDGGFSYGLADLANRPVNTDSRSAALAVDSDDGGYGILRSTPAADLRQTRTPSTCRAPTSRP